jgi:signal transduction histidine kinase/ActR/RegA family two-component response regulator
MKQKFRIELPILVVISTFVGLTWFGVLWSSEKAKQIEIERAYDSSQQLSKVFAEQVARTIDSVETLIDHAAFEILEHGTSDQLKAMADFGVLSLSPVLQITFVSPEGITISTDRGPDPSRTDLRDREHIRVHLDSKINGVYIGAPVLGRVSKKWSIQITRKVVDREKNFVGILVASVDPFYFQRFWKDTIRPGQLVTLLRSDGAILTRSYNLEKILEQRPRRTDLLAAFAGRNSGRLVAESAEGVERLGYFTNVPGWPLVVISGREVNEISALYHQQQKTLYVIGTALTIVLLILGGWLIFFAWRLREEERIARGAERAARQSEQMALAAEQTKSAFLAAMSHEIRTPLNAVVGFLELLEKTELTSEQTNYIRTMQTSAITLRNIVSDVLDFSKLEAGICEIESGPFNLHQCLDELGKVTSVLIDDKPIVVRVLRGGEVPESVMIDGPRLNQSLMNVCANAAKFTEGGEIVISFSVIESENSERLEIKVSDTGPGISSNVRPKLFTPFEQGQVSGALRAAGTGLGLYITKSLVEAMGGSIAVESEPGKGSTFYIQVPFERLTGAKENQSDYAEGQPLDPLRILIADDSRSSRTLLRILLNKKGHSVIEAEDGAQALELMESQVFDLVFLDMQMPKLGGLDVARRLLRAERAESGPIIVALTAQAQEEDKKAAAEAGIKFYITKPFYEAELDKVLSLAGKGKVSS